MKVYIIIEGYTLEGSTGGIVRYATLSKDIADKICKSEYGLDIEEFELIGLEK
jgi:hypothetical protein